MNMQRISTKHEAPFGYLSESGLVALLGDLSGDARVEGGLGRLASGACPQALFTHRFDHVLGTHAFFGRFGQHLDSRFHRAEFGGWGFFGVPSWYSLHSGRVVAPCGVLGGLAGVCRFARFGSRRGICGDRVGRCLRVLRHFVWSFQSPRRAGNTHHEGMTSTGLQGQSPWNRKLFGGPHDRYA